MSWIVLVASGVLEAVWATALDRSNSFSRPAPTAVFFVALALRMTGLAYAMRAIPVGTAHAVWVGIGAALTVALAMETGAESASPAKLVFLVDTVVSVVGPKLTR